IVLVDLIAPHVSGQVGKSVVAIVLLFMPAGILGSLGRQFGARAWKSIRGSKFGPVDSGAGAVLAIIGTLVGTWLFASVLVNSRYTLVSSQVDHSTIIRAIGDVMPPVPNEFQAVEKYLSNNGFPLAFANFLPEPPGPVRQASPADVAAVVRDEGASTVKILGDACGTQQEGTGFVVGRGYVVTNAHVVAGVPAVSVISGTSTRIATVVLFDPTFDLAVLRVPTPGLPALRLDTSLVQRGAQAVVLGYPEDGPFDAQPAGVLLRAEATGYDIYGDAQTTRTVYELDALVRPGNSGGPLLLPDGEVIGVVFSRSASDPDIGFALASPGVASRVAAAQSNPRPVSTGACIG
ncbi:MAG TPA: MarP family serine protease, partial [Acidimicrobiales bacterium]|nr:MarP family serine protease [Acidimicrobiales bacterium]